MEWGGDGGGTGSTSANHWFIAGKMDITYNTNMQNPTNLSNYFNLFYCIVYDSQEILGWSMLAAGQLPSVGWWVTITD